MAIRLMYFFKVKSCQPFPRPMLETHIAHSQHRCLNPLLRDTSSIVLYTVYFSCLDKYATLNLKSSSIISWVMVTGKCVSFIQYILRNMHTVFALLCLVVVIHWLIFPYPSGLLHWHCGNLTIAPVPAKQPWWIWINISCEFITNDCITTTKQSTTKPCAYFLGYTVQVSTRLW